MPNRLQAIKLLHWTMSCRRCLLCALLLCGTMMPGVTVFAAKLMTDPTKPPSFSGGFAMQAQNTKGFRVSTIIVTSRSKLAIINGVRVRESEEINGYTVAKILPKQVHLKKGSEVEIINLSGVRVKSILQNGSAKKMSQSRSVIDIKKEKPTRGLSYVE